MEEIEHAESGGQVSPDSLVKALNLALKGGSAETPGTRIGPYKLLQEIGRGGFGVVWMAEQDQPIKRRVAVKIIKAGMDTKEVIARFEAERQALALMDHPNIARIFDAGATDAGRPFFAMELVRGVAITTFCDDNRMPVEARLRLFMTVCQAVQHAHQKGVIHRDLKPSNILVTLHDGSITPKVIDFGIAKATMSQLTEKTLFTQFHTFIGTPAYTSPEQVEMCGQDIDTRSDIYSLGVLLYELLTGRPPFDADALVNSGLEEMRRTIRETDPPRPSTRLAKLSKQEAASAAQRRGTEPGRLSLLLRGDLDWIVMRCLEKDRTRRYESANDLARDIQRHFDSEPVAARPPNGAYRMRKFIRRHKFGFAATTAIAASLVAGLVASATLLVRERAERVRAVENFQRAQVAENAALHAEADTQRSRQQADSARRGAEHLLTYLLDEFQNKLFDTGHLGLFEQFARHTVDYYERLPPELVTDTTASDHALALALLASVLNREYVVDEAATADAKSIETFRRTIVAGDHSVDTAKGLSFALSVQAGILANQSRSSESARPLAESVAVLRPFMANPEERGALTPILAKRLMALAFGQQGDPPRMAVTMSEAARLMIESGGADPKNEDVAADYSILLKALGTAALDQGDYEKARLDAEQAISLQSAILAQSPSRLQMVQERAGAYGSLAYSQFFEGGFSEVLADLEKSNRDYDFYLSLNPTDGLIVQFAMRTKGELARAFDELGRRSEAREMRRASLKTGKTAMVANDQAGRMGIGNWGLAAEAAWAGDRVEAEKALAELSRYMSLWSKGTPTDGAVALRAGFIPRIAKIGVDIELGADPSIIQNEAHGIIADIKTTGYGNSDPEIIAERHHFLGYALSALALTELDLGRYSEAEAAATEAGDNYRAPGSGAREESDQRAAELSVATEDKADALRAEAMARQGRRKEARAILDAIVASVRKWAASHPDIVTPRTNLAEVLVQQEIATEPDNIEGRRALIAEAQALMAGMPSEVAATRSFRRSLERLEAERASIEGRGPTQG
jgi:serine/threonine protein kinase